MKDSEVMVHLILLTKPSLSTIYVAAKSYTDVNRMSQAHSTEDKTKQTVQPHTEDTHILNRKG